MSEFGSRFDVGVAAATPPEYDELGDSAAIRSEGRLPTNPHNFDFYRRKGPVLTTNRTAEKAIFGSNSTHLALADRGISRAFTISEELGYTRLSFSSDADATIAEAVLQDIGCTRE